MKHYLFSQYNVFILTLCLVFNISGVFAEMLEPASIKGCIIEKSTGNPLEFATVIVKNKKDSIINQSVTDKDGFLYLKVCNPANINSVTVL